MFPILKPSQAGSVDSDPAQLLAKVPEITLSECNLGSVLELRGEVFDGKHDGTLYNSQHRHPQH